MPKQADSSPPGIANGVGFYYMDSNLAGDLKPSTNDLSSSDQVFLFKLLFSKPNNLKCVGIGSIVITTEYMD